MIFRNYFQPDQGYFTQQPATVAQVNNLWSFIKQLRDELSLAVNEFNSHEFDLEKNFTGAREYTDSVKTELSKLITNLTKDFESLDTLLGETAANLETKITELETGKVDSVSVSGEDDTVRYVITTNGTTEYENVKFTTVDDETGISTSITEDGDGTINVAQNVPGLNDVNIANKFGVTSDADDSVVNVTYGGHNTIAIENVSHLLDVLVNENIVTITTNALDGELNDIHADISEISNTAQSVENSFTYPREVDDVVNITVSRESLDGKNRLEQNMPLISDGGTFTTYDGKLRYEPDDEFLEKFEDIHVSTAFVEPENLRIHSETAVCRYNPESKKIEQGESYNPENFILDDSGTETIFAHFAYDNARGVVAIDTSRLQYHYDSMHEATRAVVNDLAERIATLEDEVTLLKSRESNAIVEATPAIRATSNDKIEVVLQRIYANGAHDESKAAILNFRNNDHAMSIITRDNQTVSGQTDVQINMDKTWLHRQGLDRDMDTM